MRDLQSIIRTNAEAAERELDHARAEVARDLAVRATTRALEGLLALLRALPRKGGDSAP